jgi:hypothetical protein
MVLKDFVTRDSTGMWIESLLWSFNLLLPPIALFNRLWIRIQWLCGFRIRIPDPEAIKMKWKSHISLNLF